MGSVPGNAAHIDAALAAVDGSAALPHHRIKRTPDYVPVPKAWRKSADPRRRIMKHQCGCLQGFNLAAVVAGPRAPTKVPISESFCRADNEHVVLRMNGKQSAPQNMTFHQPHPCPFRSYHKLDVP